jgi:hypothetical protein
MPLQTHWKTLRAMYPEAKILMTVRWTVIVSLYRKGSTQPTQVCAGSVSTRQVYQMDVETSAKLTEQ